MQPFANIIEQMPIFSRQPYVGLMKFVIEDLGAHWDTLLAIKHIKLKCKFKKIAKTGTKL